MKDKKHLLKPHKYNDRFSNSKNDQRKGFIFDTIRMLFGSIMHRVKDAFRSTNEWIVNEEPVKRSGQLAITWIGHSTFLIQIDGINILADPIFGNPSFLFPRILPPGISLQKLPAIDYILLSHNHPDHMEEASLLFLKERDNPTMLVPLGVKQWFDKNKIDNTKEFDWWQNQEFSLNVQGTPIRFTFLPAYHWSARGLFDKNRTLWGSWMIECNGKIIYFGGDTVYSEHFNFIAQEFPNIDVSLLPIGPCEPKRCMKHSHMNAQGAIQAFQDLNARHFVPMHWGTFHFGVESFDNSIKQLQTNWQKTSSSLSGKILHISKVGQRLHF